MVLKSLILQGFKSFPDKTQIHFAEGVTAIVGPNGSGKSNISDAIRWVLGEQSSRSLRGAKMEDIIFSGTTKRGPVGFADVSLILDNTDGLFRSDFTEIMITRRFFRSGDSEYYMNKQHCRLRDIHEMFMDTGLGRDGYSVIGQGRIDEILSLKSEDRREVFEEAAGITKFRFRKQEAERKLAATEENLVRIRDLYQELEVQREPLEKQASRAKQYLLLRDELRVLEISLWLLKLSALRKDTQENQEKFNICMDQLESATRERDSLYTKSDALTEEIHSVEIALEKLRMQLRETEQRLAEHASRTAVMEANIQNNQENIVRTRLEKERQAVQAQNLTEQLTERKAHVTQLAHTWQTLLKDQADLARQEQELQLSAQQLRIEREEVEKRKQSATEQKFSAELALMGAQSGLDNMDARHDTIENDLQAAQERVAAEEQTQTSLEARLAACLTTIDESKNRLAGVDLKMDSRRRHVQQLEEENQRVLARANDCDNRIRMLTEMQREYEGFSHSVRMIMNLSEKGGMAGIHGPVSSLMEVSEEYVTAVETALGAAGNNLVVDSPQVGREAIQYLKRKEGGRATFLPLDTIRPASLQERGIENMTGFCGIADTLVTCAPQYRNIISNILGRTVVAQDLNAALAIAKAYHNRFRIVTLDGQVVQAGGAMTGGSASKSTGVLARAAKLHSLETQQQELANKQKEAVQALEKARKELTVLEFDIKAMQAERARAQEEQAGLNAHCQQHSALVESLRAQYQALTLERDNLSEARVQYEQTIAVKTAEIEDIGIRLDELDSMLQGLEQQQRLKEEQQLLLAQKHSQLATAVAQNQTETAAERRALSDLEMLRQGMNETLEDSQKAIARFEEEINRLQQALEQAGLDNQRDAAAAQQLREQITQHAQKRTQIEGEKNAIGKRAQEQGESIMNLEREKGRLENRTIQIQNEEKQIVDKMWESYELTPSPAEEIKKELPDVPEAEKQAQALKNQMRALGNINLDAVEEYEKLMERYTFMTVQKEDLENAQKDLYKIINELTENMKEIFATEFARLNNYFGQTFREMFGGGHAELVLEDTTDILGCGIEIRVSPPGKALKTITLLSGGEKAFVAIALYFAILKVRPTPFCVLDEIEAALDDVNVIRYAKYMRRLSDNTQFIAITHRRGTMEEADILYGVTMQEQGVSKLLMLNLAEAEQRLNLKIE